MVVDAHGLVHGGFVFGLADYAAMLAVNDPNVVLGAAEARFLKPVRRGDQNARFASRRRWIP
jgi:acyl-coenzyme A thioesterase PaaI-like protein